MPLSEDEQRILRQIEQELRSDPGFDTRESSVSAVRLIWLALALVVAIVMTVAVISVHPLVALVGFVLSLWIGLKLESEARSVMRGRFSEAEVQAWLAGIQGRSRRDHDDREQ